MQFCLCSFLTVCKTPKHTSAEELKFRKVFFAKIQTTRDTEDPVSYHHAYPSKYSHNASQHSVSFMLFRNVILKTS